MPGVSMPPSFELAMRRTLFFLILIAGYLAIGTVSLRYFRKSHAERMSSLDHDRVDLKRAELLNVLWAETVARTENDWYRVANQKMDNFEKILQTHNSLRGPPTNDGSFGGAFLMAFRMITTIGAIETEELSSTGQIFAMAYSLLGVPLALLYLGQCNRMVQSVLGGWSLVTSLAAVIFVGAVAIDIVDRGTDSTPFTNDLYSVFLLFTTIGEESPKLKGALACILSLIGLSLASVTFVTIQHKLERLLQPFETSFSLFFGQLASWKEKEKDEAEERNNGDGPSSNHYRIVEEEEEEEEEED